MQKFGIQFLMMILVATSVAMGQTSNAAGRNGSTFEPHPTLSHNGTWVGILLIVIIGLFVMAAVIGPIVQANLSEEIPPTHSYDEPPGASGHHGASGTIRR
jgi:hypothetical protein